MPTDGIALDGLGLKKIDTLFLDAGGVLIDPNWQRISSVLARHGIEASADALAEAQPRAKLALDVPMKVRASDDRSRCAEYWGLVLEHAGIHHPAETLAPAWRELDEYHKQWNLWETVLPGVPEALARLRDAGCRLVIVSNANGTLQANLAGCGLDRLVDDVLDSSVVGVEKPDRLIFDMALKRAGAIAARALHVGDMYEVDVVGARSAGIAAVLIDPHGLYAGRDCPRAASFSELADLVLAHRR